MLHLIYNSFKSFCDYCRFCRVISLAVLIAFSTSVISPAFAEVAAETTPDSNTSVEEQTKISSPNVDDKVEDKDQQMESQKLEQGEDMQWANQTVGFSDFLNDYVEFAPNYFYKEFIKKVAGRLTRSYMVTGKELSPVFPPLESTVFMRRNVEEVGRNINLLVKKNNAKGNYQESGKIIRNSLLAHLILWPVQVGVGQISGPMFEKMGLPEETAKNVGIYAKNTKLNALTNELAIKTPETIIAFEHPELQWIPTAVNTGALILFYKFLPSQGASPTDFLKRYALVETTAAVATTAVLAGGIMYDRSYDKYEVFNVTVDEMLDFSTLHQIAQYGLPVFASQATNTLAGVANIMLIGMVGREALGTKKTFDQLALFLNTAIAASSQAGGAIVTESVASSESPEAIESKMHYGLWLNSIVSGMYLMVAIYPTSYLAPTPEAASIVRTSALVNFATSLERTAKDELAAFKQDEQSWIKSAGDALKIAIPFGGWVLFRFNLVERNANNYRRIQFLNFIPVALTVLSLFNVRIPGRHY